MLASFLRLGTVLFIAGLVFILSLPSVEAKNFAVSGWGVRFDYAETWEAAPPHDYTVVLSPQDPTAPALVAVSLQNQHAPGGDKSGPGEAGAEAMASRYIKEVTSRTLNAQVLRSVPFSWRTPADGTITGRQTVIEFVEEGVPLRQWAVFLPSPFAPVVHVWIYSAPQMVFDSWLPDARKSLDSLVPTTPGRPDGGIAPESVKNTTKTGSPSKSNKGIHKKGTASEKKKTKSP